jgi:hypothetical protein
MITPSIVSDQVLLDEGKRGEAMLERVRAGSREGLLPWSRTKRTEQLVVQATQDMQQGKRDEALYKVQRALTLNHNMPDAIALRESLLGQRDLWPTGSMQQEIISGELQKKIADAPKHAESDDEAPKTPAPKPVVKPRAAAPVKAPAPAKANLSVVEDPVPLKAPALPPAQPSVKAPAKAPAKNAAPPAPKPVEPAPATEPTPDPTMDPATDPSADPTADPSMDPTVEPTMDPDPSEPSAEPSTEPGTDPDPSTEPGKDPNDPGLAMTEPNGEPAISIDPIQRAAAARAYQSMIAFHGFWGMRRPMTVASTATASVTDTSELK